MSEHLDLDALADVLAGERQDAHVATCAACRSRLQELEAAMPGVVRALGELPEPEVPAGLAERLDRATATARQVPSADVVPMLGRRVRWLPALAAVAAAAALVTGGILYSQRGSSPRTTVAGGAHYAVNDTGADYSPARLAAALPALLKGNARAADTQSMAGVLSGRPSPVPTPAAKSDFAAAAPSVADPLAALRTVTGLATCLASLSDASEPGLPLALDYASFAGKPALVVVLPSSKADKVDVFVVPPGCARADGQVLFFTRLTKP